MSFFGNKTN